MAVSTSAENLFLEMEVTWLVQDEKVFCRDSIERRGGNVARAG